MIKKTWVQKKPKKRLSVSSHALHGRWKAWQIGNKLPDMGASPWESRVRLRMRLIRFLSVLTTLVLVFLSDQLITGQHLQLQWRIVYLSIYGAMMFFMAGNFYKVLFGAWYARRGPKGNPWHPMNHLEMPTENDRVAVLFPVYHEDVSRVAAGMAACYRSLAENYPAYLPLFDFHLLSDSRKAGYRITELASIYRLRNLFQSHQFFYRSRPVNSNAKLGNVTDFFRRYGSEYPFALVMDADSVMDGEAIVTLLQGMVGNPRIGILQSNPRPVFRETVFGRMQQFASHLYGSVFSYSMQAMYMGHAIYIGHNAMIRVKPFMRYAILPQLKGKKPWGGKPLSHDIIEAVALGRAGYEVWFLPELSGSYEEIPANMLGFLIRERRWMMGNLQHIRFWFLRGVQGLHRETLINGVMAYFSAPLWFAFLFVSAYGVLHFMGVVRISVVGLKMLKVPAGMLLASSLVFLFLPRIMAVMFHIDSKRATHYGGKDKLLWSVVLETVFSFLWSPIMMIYISLFFWQWIRGKSVSWGAQDRGDTALSLKDSWTYFGKVSIFGLSAWVALVYYVKHIPSAEKALLYTLSSGWVHPYSLLVWYFPVLGGMALSVWLARWSSFRLQSLKKIKLFMISEEVREPKVLQDTRRAEAKFRNMLPDPDDFHQVWDFATTCESFIRCHLPEIRERPQIYKRFTQNIQSKVYEKDAWLWITDKLCYQKIIIQAQQIG
ncbi:glucans biosynthesis glucosyltransferase MdoH [Acidithiobacillus sp. HP-11]|uniref:glucans biosynthesis glucosyltransferase MdoH n=1 Tax=Acidithiobacillus sp. HP-11 TaxID=2697656 RepID=UPI00187A09FC|nr:glucans biosynthesis glucosyltransferase MdoH [Acidithiobacillus sp. HP-11]MBE7566667.1 glucans biosynthesis glucosyltransferase MdoH [Acidithiobacillus sp. HP-11]